MTTPDVIVIGAGIGGLTTAALLARRGLRVQVLERRETPGGCCTSHVEDGFTFDIASSLFYGFGAKGFNANRRVLDELGVELDLFSHDPGFEIVHHGHRLPVHRDLAAWLDALGGRFPSLRRGLGRFYAELEPLYEEILRVGFFPLGDANLLDLARLALGQPGLIKTYVPLLNKTVWDALEPHLRGADPGEVTRFKHLLDVDLAFGSCTPSHELPLLHAVPILMDRHVGGIHYPRGGASALPAALVRGLERHGGSIRYGAEVTRILASGGRASGVQLASGERLEARHVVCNANIWSLYGDLLPGGAAPARLTRRVEALTPSSSAFVVCLAVEADVLPAGFLNHTVSIPASSDDLRDVSILYAPSVDDPTLAPPGYHAVTLVHLTDYAAWVRPGAARATEDEALDRLHIDRAITWAEAVLPGLRQRSRVVARYSPATLERVVGRRFGAVGGPAHNLKQALNQRAGNKTPLPGLYLVGDSTYPGEGVVAVTISGLTCADQIAPALAQEERRYA